MNQRQAILKVLESNSRISPAELAVRLGYSEEEVIKTIAELEADRIIVGYHTLINWEQTISSVSAIIELRLILNVGKALTVLPKKYISSQK